MRHPSPYIFSATLRELVNDLNQSAFENKKLHYFSSLKVFFSNIIKFQRPSLRHGSNSFLTLNESKSDPLSLVHLFVKSGINISETVLSKPQSIFSGDNALITPPTTSLCKIYDYKWK